MNPCEVEVFDMATIPRRTWRFRRTLGVEYLERLLEREGIHDALVHRGGLRARIVDGGEISVGDNVKTVGLAESASSESRDVDSAGQ